MSTMHDQPVELLRLRTALAAVLNYIREADQWAEQAADVNRLVRPDYARKLDDLRAELRDAQLNGCIGSPAAIALRLAELLEEGR